jgi:two-component system response regulator PilR (NtrC family)
MMAAPGKHRILVIDDEADIRECLDMLLSSVGYEVSTVESGGAAVERAERESFDLAITDLRMPGLSGEETVAALRRIMPGISVIVVSGYVSDESALRCREAGATRIMSKPFDVDDLLHVVEAALCDRPPERRDDC